VGVRDFLDLYEGAGEGERLDLRLLSKDGLFFSPVCELTDMCFSLTMILGGVTLCGSVGTASSVL
jgi:hypothetical protein